jgi:hypothetical protein
MPERFLLTTNLLRQDRAAEWAFGMMPYGARWRAHRKLCNDVLNVRLTGEFDDHQYRYAYRLLTRLMEAPEHFMRELDL